MADTRPSIAARRQAFHDLHRSGCFIIPNPWDVGSARYLQGLGFPALATTSSGYAWSQGRPDNGVARTAVLAHLREIVAATDVPNTASQQVLQRLGFIEKARSAGLVAYEKPL